MMRKILSVVLLFFTIFSVAAVRHAVFAQPSGARTVTTPILYLYDTNSSNDFYLYLLEILRAEGINLVSTATISSFPGNLQNYSLIILGETTDLTAGNVTALTSYVQNGGMLLAMRPQSSLASLFGLTAAGSLSEGYLRMSSGSEITEGLTTEVLQFHGTASQYTASGSVVTLATLYSDASTATAYPAVSYIQSGEGYAAQFAFDIAKSTAYMRQGNPSWKNQDSNGDSGMRPLDLFINPSDNNDHWNDLSLLEIPQADEQMRLFSNLILFLLDIARTPVPKFWYYPDFDSSVAVSTGDEHAESATYSQLRVDDLEALGGTGSIYLRTNTLNPPVPSTTQYNTWTAAGHELSVHPYYQDIVGGDQANITYENAETVIEDTVAAFVSKYGASPGLTIRNHFLFWTGWHDMAEIQANNGFRMGLDYYICCQYTDAGYGLGYFTGSALPLKHVSETGEVLNIYQQQTNWSDETWPGSVNSSQRTRSTAAFAHQALAKYNTVLSGHAHVGAEYQPYDDSVFAYAVTDKGISLRSAERWYRFWSTKNGITYSDYSFNQVTGALSFTATIPGTGVVGDTYTMMLPYTIDNATLTAVSINGSNQSISTTWKRGRQYAYYNLTAGSKAVTATYTLDTLTNTVVREHTTVTDFSSCTFTNTSYVKTDTPGLELASALYDDFDDNTFDTSLWEAGAWNDPHGAYTPSISNGIMTIYSAPDGGFIRSDATYTRTALEFRGKLASGQHKNLGFADLDFASEYITFKGNDANTLALTTGGFSELTTLPFNQFRTFLLDNSRSSGPTLYVDYYLDGSLEKTLNTGSSANMHVYFSNTNTTGGSEVQLDWVKLHSYPSTSGTFQSCTVDLGDADTDAIRLDWRATTPAGTSITLQTRTSANGSSWSDWSTAISTRDTNTDSTPARYVQYRINFSGTSAATPTVHSVTVKGIDETNPVISGITATSESTALDVNWDSDEKTTGTVEYGLDTSYGSSTTVNTFPKATEHTAELTSLVSCAQYYYRISGTDVGLNTVTSAAQTALTAGCAGNAAVEDTEVGAVTTGGGSLELVNSGTGVALTIPSGFHGSAATFQIHKLAGSTVASSIGAPSGKSLVTDQVYELRALTDVQTALTSFSQPITVVFTYDQADITGLAESNLVAYRWDGSAWQQLSGCTVDTVANTVTCTTVAFSTFALAGSAPTDTGSDSSNTAQDSSANSSNTSTGPMQCSAVKPGAKLPHVYAALARSATTAEVFFSSADGPVTGYILEYGSSSGVYNFGGVAISGADARTYLIKDLSPNTTYYFRIRAVNDCAYGEWSNELSVKTAPRFAQQVISVDDQSYQLRARQTTKSDSCKSLYTVQEGDTLWKIAARELGDGTRYSELRAANSDVYPALQTADTLQRGWELVVPCDDASARADAISTDTNETQLNTHTVRVLVQDTERKPVAGASVTLHSTPRQTTTNEDGVAEFSAVESGEHRVIIEHEGASSEQSIHLSGDVEMLEVTVTLRTPNPFSDIRVLVTIAVLLLIIAGVIFKYWKSQRQQPTLRRLRRV